jgi:methionine biosynthesis protein MetW
MKACNSRVDGPFESLQMAPDSYISDLTGIQPDPLRYDGIQLHPFEVPMLIAKMIPIGAKVLDVGCGSGLVSGFIQQERSAYVIGVEPDIVRAAIARNRGIQVEAGFLSESMIERLGTFDIVVLADVLEHCAHPGQLLRLAKKFLRPSGCLIVSVPNVAHWTVRQSLLFGKFDYQSTGILDATHLRWFTKKTLLELLDRIGIDVMEIKYSAGTMLPVYNNWAAFRFMPYIIKNAVIQRLALSIPKLFACQFVVCGRVLTSH